MTEKEMWQKFIKKNKIENAEYSAWQFGSELSDQLADLAADGIKTATASAFDLYEMENEPLPEEGNYNIILNSKNEAVCIIKTIKVYVVPFKDVTEEHAFKEGEGDKSLEYWRTAHEKFFKEELENFNYESKIVCEEFEVVYK